MTPSRPQEANTLGPACPEKTCSPTNDFKGGTCPELLIWVRFPGSSTYGVPVCILAGTLARSHASYPVLVLCTRKERGASGAVAEGLNGQVFKTPEGQFPQCKVLCFAHGCSKR